MPIIGNNGTSSIFDPLHIPLAEDHSLQFHGLSCEAQMHKSELAILDRIDIIETVSERSGKVSNLNPQDIKDKVWREYGSISTSSKSTSPKPSEFEEAPKPEVLEPAYTEPFEAQPQKMHEACDTGCASPVILTKELLERLIDRRPSLSVWTPQTRMYTKIISEGSYLQTPLIHGGHAMDTPVPFEEPSSAQPTPI